MNTLHMHHLAMEKQNIQSKAWPKQIEFRFQDIIDHYFEIVQTIKYWLQNKQCLLHLMLYVTIQHVLEE